MKQAKEAYASFASGALAVDDSCKTANQRITRGQALLIADKLADYQMNYLADHAQTQIAEVRQIPGKDGTITLPAMSYTTFNKKWSDSIKRAKRSSRMQRQRKKSRSRAERQPKKNSQKKMQEQITEETKSKENASRNNSHTETKKEVITETKKKKVKK